MMFVVLELNQILLVVHTQIIITVDTLRMQESGVVIVSINILCKCLMTCSKMTIIYNL